MKSKYEEDYHSAVGVVADALKLLEERDGLKLNTIPIAEDEFSTDIKYRQLVGSRQGYRMVLLDKDDLTTREQVIENALMSNTRGMVRQLVDTYGTDKPVIYFIRFSYYPDNSITVTLTFRVVEEKADKEE